MKDSKVSTTYKKILIRMPNWIGDAVMATPALENLINFNPKNKIILLLSPTCFSLFSVQKRFICYKDLSKKSKNRFFYYKRLAKNIQEEQGKIDISITFTNSLSSRIALWLLNSKQKIAMRHHIFEPFLTETIRINRNQHQVLIYNDLINKIFKINRKANQYKLKTTANFQIKNHTIAIAPGASFGTAKCWKAEYYAKLCSMLAKKYPTLNIIILGNQAEFKTAEKIITMIPNQLHSKINNLCGKTSLEEIMSILKQIKLLVCNDSGIMHMAAAFKTATVAIFGPTKHWQTYAWKNPKYKLIYKDLNCAPCMQRTCPLKHHQCMDKISPSEIFKALETLLNFQ